MATPVTFSRRRVWTAGVATNHCVRRPRGSHGDVLLAASRQRRSQTRSALVAVRIFHEVWSKTRPPRLRGCLLACLLYYSDLVWLPTTTSSADSPSRT